MNQRINDMDNLTFKKLEHLDEKKKEIAIANLR